MGTPDAPHAAYWCLVWAIKTRCPSAASGGGFDRDPQVFLLLSGDLPRNGCPSRAVADKVRRSAA